MARYLCQIDKLVGQDRVIGIMSPDVSIAAEGSDRSSSKAPSEKTTTMRREGSDEYAIGIYLGGDQ